ATGTLTTSSSFSLGIVGGIVIDLPVSSRSFLTPEVQFSIPITSQTSVGTWRSFALTAGASLRLGLIDISPRTAQPDTQGRKIAHLPVLIPTILTKPARVGVRVDEYDSIEALPLLNQIFFSESSDTLPDRYHLVSADQS